MSTPVKVLLLAGKGASSRPVYHYLSRYFDVSKVILEDPVPKKTFLKRRVRNLGLLTVIGQLSFMVVISPLLKRISRKRIISISEKFGLNYSSIPTNKVQHVPSINDDTVISYVQEEQPDVIVINGTRIISKKILQATGKRFINIHAGITPAYRGVHGGYWALANNDSNNCGVTVHFVDAGIDTGKIIAQARIYPEKPDNFITYPILQLAAGLPLLKNAIEGVVKGEITEQESKSTSSKLWYHPTLFSYLKNFILKGVK